MPRSGRLLRLPALCCAQSLAVYADLKDPVCDLVYFPAESLESNLAARRLNSP